MSRSNYTPEPPRQRAPKMEQPELVVDAEPQTITVNGDGLREWSARQNTGEIHIFKMIVNKGWTYTLHMMWLHGRKLYTGSRPSPGNIQDGLALFK